MRLTGPKTIATVALTALLGLTSAPASADLIRVQSTTDTVDAGLVEGLLRPAYKAAQPGDDLAYTAVGTGKALDNARNGLADVVITHAPSLEKQFSDQGYSLEGPGRAIFYSDYVIVGPKTDPAGVRAAATHDAVAALEQIAAAGGQHQASFVSRGDNSGTNVQEQLMWHMTGPGVVKQQAANAGSATDRDEPGSGGSYPSWYGKTNVGQATSLQKADVCSSAEFPDGGCYTMVDRGTFNRLDSSGTITKLAILSENNDSGARGGKDLLINPFSAYIVDAAALPSGSAPVNATAARRFLDFLTSESFQTAVDSFPTATNPAFRGDAFPSVSVDSALPPATTAGSPVTVALTLRNRQPGAPAVNGQPVQLQASTDAGASWTNVGGPQPTDAAGRVRFETTVTATTRYRVALGRFQATIWNSFSPNVQEIGIVSVVAPDAGPAPQPGPTPAPVPAPAPAPGPRPAAPDRAAPKVTKLGLSARRLTLRIGEAGSVRVTIARRTVTTVRRAGKTVRKTSYRTVATVRGSAKRAGTLKLSWKRALPRGSYRVSVRAVDAAGNARTRQQRLTIKR